MNSSKVHNQLNKWKCIDFRLLFFQFSRFERTNSRFLVLIFIFVIIFFSLITNVLFTDASSSTASACRKDALCCAEAMAPMYAMNEPLFPPTPSKPNMFANRALYTPICPYECGTSLDSQLILCYSHSIIADLTIDLCMKIIWDERW